MSAYQSLFISRLPLQLRRQNRGFPVSYSLSTSSPSPLSHLLWKTRWYSSNAATTTTPAHLFPPKPVNYPYEVSLGKISKIIAKPPGNEKLVPTFGNPNERYLTSTDIRHLEWMVKKELMKQDMFLIGPPGGYKRRLVKLYGYIMSREMEIVQISRDTTEADIKQRREIKDKSVIYHDQASVRCALKGHVLVLDGIEKAERNVLPLLNNLLENREMHLEDGRHLIPHNRYDALLKEHGNEAIQRWKLERVHEDFRVISLGLPVPAFKGNPLDPPLRSRFQARNVGGGITRDEILSVLLQNLKNDNSSTSATAAIEDGIQRMVDLSYGINLLRDDDFRERRGGESFMDDKQVPWFVVDNLFDGARLYKELVNSQGGSSLFSFLSPSSSSTSSTLLPSLFSMMYPFSTNNKQVSSLVSQHLGGDPTIPIAIKISGSSSTVSSLSPSPLPSQLNTLSSLHSFTKLDNNQRACLLYGPGGSGKSTIASYLEKLLDRKATVIQVYKDMSTRELFQSRTTDSNGNTLWQDNALTKCCKNGEICVLDGIHSLHPSVYSVLGKLVQDGEVILPDGESMLKVHPNFRLIAIADSGEMEMEMNEDISSVFLVFPVEMGEGDELKVAGEEARKVLEVTKELRRRGDGGDKSCKSLARALSVGQVKRIGERLKRGEGRSADLFQQVNNATLGMFLPMMERDLLVDILRSCGITKQEKGRKGGAGQKRKIEVEGNSVKIGSVTARISEDTEFNGKVPKGGTFFEIDQHLEVLEALADDFIYGGDHLLVIGNQGVGKNKLVDRLLELLNRPREYIQLHRDTTVQSLTTSQRIEKGVIVTDDSPLVNAARHGLVLVVDEADKAPAHVTAILKTLAERGEMHLSDGRVISSKEEGDKDGKVIKLHPDFRMMVLANRPGFPFLGNSFYSVLSHLFSVHPVDNPSVESEIQLLRSYGPDVGEEDVKKIASIFAELRGLSDEGVLAYPYSTREAVHVVRHMQHYPGDWQGAFSNVFDFDRWSEDVWKVVEKAVEGHLGIVGVLSRKDDKEGVVLRIHEVGKKGGGGEGGESPRTDFSKYGDPKEGKFDPTGNPHVGGNTWAGGSGGMTTAGLGGVGGPYRLTDGNPVFQVSPEVKQSVPPEVLQKARELSKQLYEEKLRELKMSKHDGSIYNDFLNPIRAQIQTLRNVLDGVQSKKKERKWVRHQSMGDLDDQKLIEGLIGDKNVYRQRQELNPEMGDPQEKPKLLRLLVDCSGSMYRFNTMDGRLDRMLSCMLMVMEAFAGYEHIFKFEINGHSGDEWDWQLKGKGEKLKEEKGRMEVMKKAFLHSQFCMSGDHTLEATAWSLKELQKVKEEHDEVFLVILSDANLERYGISASEFGRVLTSQGTDGVQAYCLFIGSIGDQAKALQESLPVGKGFVCMDITELPKIFQRIFTEGILR